MHGLQLTAFMGAVVMVGLALLTIALLRDAAMGTEPERQPDPWDGLTTGRA